MTKHTSVFARFLVVVAVLALSLTAVAQIQTGQITGTILDQQGAAISGATVKVTSLGTGQTTSSTTGDTGLFMVKELPAGPYKITVEKQGFKTASQSSFTVNAGVTHRVDFKLTVGERTEVVEVLGTAPLVNTEDSKLATTVGQEQIANLPLNGRNVYDLIQLSPGAVNVKGTDFENGLGTVVNGLRENFNGFLVNGVANKGVSGGLVNTPIEDTVQEFQQLTLNNSAQYGNSAGSISNLVTKSGTNSFHGSGWWFVRNDIFDANQFFINQSGAPKPPLRFNQFGGTIGGPIIKDKLFFFASYQGDHFRETSPAVPTTFESPDFRAAVASVFPNSVANLLYNTANGTGFVPAINGTLSNSCGGPCTLANYIASGFSASSFTSFNDYLCANNYSGSNTAVGSGQGSGIPDPRGVGYLPQQFATLFGYTPADDAGCPLTANSQGVPYNLNAAALARRNMPFLFNGASIFTSQNNSPFGNLFQGKEASARLDYNWNDKNRLFLQVNWFHSTDAFGPCNAACSRGFSNPGQNYFPNGQFNFVHTFSPRVLNEFRAGYVQNNLQIGSNIPGVPQVTFGDATGGFGSYNGYPQFFKENIYSYGDMLSISHGKHSLKIGGEVRRNIENSVFNVARPSYYFFDPLFFAVDSPAEQVAGVDPGIVSGNPSQLASNVRHWRNVEYGIYFQDDWKISRRLTLNLGIRYDLYARHTEENGLATTFIKGPGNSIIDNISTGAGQIKDANILAGNLGCTTPTQLAQAQLAGVCGPGGFAAASSLGAGDHNDFGPRVGFAWDVFGNGKTSIRGGFGVSYEATLYNPLSNSRWNLPFYSFNIADNFLNGDVSNIIYGPGPFLTNGCPNCVTPAIFTGPATNPGQGVGAQAVGNLTGWDSTNPNLAFLTGIVFPEGIRDPYVYNYFLGFQRELMPKLVLEVDYVGTDAHKLFRAANVNLIPGGRLPAGTCTTDDIGRTICGQGGTGRLNQNYGTLRQWANQVNSNYNSLQVALRKQASHGISFNVNYTWSHSLDAGSTWHSGATTANGAAGGEGYNTDQTRPGLDYGNSIFDIRHRLVANYVWETHLFKGKGGFSEAVLGGWTVNGIWSFQSGPHWSPFASRSRSLSGDCSQAGITAGLCINTGGDYNLDRNNNDRPNSVSSNVTATHDMWAGGFNLPVGFFTAPCLGCAGDLRRDQFVGPGNWVADMSLLKNIKITERVKLQFRSEFFNIFNHTNFVLATAGGAGHNSITDPSFGQAGGTLNSRNIQFGLRLTF